MCSSQTRRGASRCARFDLYYPPRFANEKRAKQTKSAVNRPYRFAPESNIGSIRNKVYRKKHLHRKGADAFGIIREEAPRCL